MTHAREEAALGASITEGLDRAPHRAFLRAHRRRRATTSASRSSASSASTARTRRARCRSARRPTRRASASRRGEAMPVPFTTISVSDGVSMNHGGMRDEPGLARDDRRRVEAVVRGHAYDALVGFAGCDKTLPGMMMAMVRLERARRSSSTAARCCRAPGAAATSRCSTPTKASAR